ncbi:MAG: efflux RND transporter periplasmic adaptor subunit [Bradyrhizobium sp.]|uniref:efflux RND transporter periplasmic adaptor subunit n=1 Tax=Bradyrhizobium sp. TaxID=376 RepID=UPI003D0EA545
MLRGGVTTLMMGALLLALYALWVRYQVLPLTRDGKVQADIVPVAPDVGGLLTEVLVKDNQTVKQGEVLLRIDPVRYRIALKQAEANLGMQRVLLEQALREDRRNRAVREELAPEAVEQGSTRVQQLRMAEAQAEAARQLAALNLERTELRAPVDGVIANVNLQPGLYLSAGKPALALVYSRSLRVEGYFEETKLQRITVGDPASVHLMGEAGEIHGHVESIAGGVQDRERGSGEAQLANINPSFTWVRLAQRIPVRIAIDSISPGMRLVPGQTATVEVHSQHAQDLPFRGLLW